jgi:hypothetical protein
MNGSVPVAADHAAQRAALERLVVDNPDLESLEALLGQFNIFEVLGAVRHELRHSDFLAFLLDPSQNHGLGDEFARRLLQKVLVSAGNQPLPITPIDLDVWDLNELVVLREWQNIDILLLDEARKVAIIIENKIWSGEHSNQLDRYYQTVSRQHPGWKILGILLSPEGEIPTHSAYLPADYTTVCQVVERITVARSSTLGADVRTLMTHYTQMLRRHIVSDSEIAKLCRRIYKNHKDALDLIFEHRPDQQAEIRELLERLIGETSGLAVDHASKSYIKFFHEVWDVPLLRSGQGWSPSGRMLLFEIANRPESLKLNLYIGPGPEDTRQGLFDMARNNPAAFKTASRTLNQKWNAIYGKTFLGPKDYLDTGDEQLEKMIRKRWAEFVNDDLPKITEAVRGQEWIGQVA